MADCRHFPAFNQLCDKADKAGLQIRLPVTTETTQSSGRRGEDYRMLTRVELWIDDLAPATAVEIRNDDLEAASLELLKCLE